MQTDVSGVEIAEKDFKNNYNKYVKGFIAKDGQHG